MADEQSGNLLDLAAPTAEPRLCEEFTIQFVSRAEEIDVAIIDGEALSIPLAAARLVEEARASGLEGQGAAEAIETRLTQMRRDLLNRLNPYHGLIFREIMGIAAVKRQLQKDGYPVT